MDTYGRPHPLIYLHEQGAHFIFIRRDTKRPAHKWRDPELKYIPTLQNIIDYTEERNVIFPTQQGKEPRANKAGTLTIAFIPASLNLLGVDVDAPEYTRQIQGSIGQPITGVSTPSGGYHLFYKLPPEVKHVYAKPYTLPDIPFSIGELRINGYCLIYDPAAIAYATQEAGRESVPCPPLNLWPLNVLASEPHPTSARPPGSSRDYSANTAPQDDETVDMLSYVHSESYEDFFRILMALKHGQESGELQDAYQVALAWVNSGNVPPGRNMDAHEGLEHIWNTSQPDGSSTMATITFLANESGYVPSSFGDGSDVDIVVPEGGAAARLNEANHVQTTLNGGSTSSPATLPVANSPTGNGHPGAGEDDVGSILNVPAGSAASPPSQAPPSGSAPAAPLRGQPPGRPTKRTGNNLRNLARTLFHNKALENDLPKYLRFDDAQLVDCDVERILHYCIDQLFVMDNNIYVSSRQLWKLMSTTDPISHALVRDITMSARQAAYGDLPEDFYDEETGESEYGDALVDSVIDARHIETVVKTLRYSMYDSRFRVIPANKVNDREKYPILPFTDGTSIDLRSKTILSVEQVRPLLLLDHGWVIHPPKTLPALLGDAVDEIERNRIQHDWDITQAHLNGRYSNVIDRLSMYACGTTKSIDVMAYPTDGGKSAIVDALNGAFGEDTFIAITGKKALGQNNRFNPLSWYLTSAMGVFVIELHGREIDSGDMNAWVENTQEFEKKGIDVKRGRRIGTVMLAGDEEPINFSSDSQGWKTRIKWVENRLEESPMSGADYVSMQSEAGTQCLLQHFIECAHRRFQQESEQWKIRKIQETERSGDTDWLHNQARDPVILAIMELFEPASSLDFVPTESIVKALKAFAKKNEDFGLDSKKIPTTRQINVPFKKAFPRIEQTGNAPKPITKKHDSGKGMKATRGYEYFKPSPAGATLLADLDA